MKLNPTQIKNLKPEPGKKVTRHYDGNGPGGRGWYSSSLQRIPGHVFSKKCPDAGPDVVCKARRTSTG